LFFTTLNIKLEPLGLQFNIYLGDMTKAVFTGLSDTLTSNNGGFIVSTTVSNDTLRVVVFSGNGAVLDPNVHLIGRLCFDMVDDNAYIGMEVPVILDAVIVGDAVSELVVSSNDHGLLQIGIRGNLKRDCQVSILDIIALVRFIIGSDSVPEPGSITFNTADVNCDGSLSITDVIAQVNIILSIPSATKPSSPVAVTVSLEAIVTLSDGSAAIPVIIDGYGVAGLQAAFTFDPSLMSVGTPVLANESEGLMLDSHTENGTLRLIALSLNGQTLSAGQTVLIPVSLTGTEEARLIMADLIASSVFAQTIPVQLGTVVQPVSGKGTSTPASFSLSTAAPNPFNPSTTISYGVSQSTHIQVTVYNLLGQEVIRLINQIQQPGRCQITWNALNARGAPVSSGVYLYRLTCSTGYSDSKRVTLLK
jgi:hypothetical protein